MKPSRKVTDLFLLLAGFVGAACLLGSTPLPRNEGLICGRAPMNCADTLASGQVSCGTYQCDDVSNGSPWMSCDYCPRGR